MDNQYFIAVYTNEVKDYCEEKFFNNLSSLSRNEPVFVADNSFGNSYFDKLKRNYPVNEFKNFNVCHVEVPQHPKESQFQRNVCDSVNFLRQLYLNTTNLPYFLILESDVYSPLDLLDRFGRSICQLSNQDPDWGILGGLYYAGFHNYQFNTTHTTLEKTDHCLSGCTVYKRTLIEKYPFRYDPENLGPFPDAFISYDSKNDFNFWNEHLIKCEHLHNPKNGLRVR